MILNIIIWAICLVVNIIMRFGLIDWRRTLHPFEQEAFWEIQHVFFGLGLGAFFTILFNDIISFLISLICIFSWEVFEEWRWKSCTKYPIDTVLDVMIGGGFALLVIIIL